MFYERQNQENEKTCQDWEKMFAEDASDKALLSKMYKAHLKLNNKNTTHVK